MRLGTRTMCVARAILAPLAGARQFWICTARYNFQDLAASNNGDCVQLPGDIGRPSLTETSDVRAVTGSVAISAFLPVFWFIEPTSGEVQFVSPRRNRTAALG
jgi:hypothetical protein